MIQLASDPNAHRTAWRPVAAQGQGTTLEARRARHAWPFISPHGDKPAAQQPPKDSNGSSGS
jgi:hypothetical protein